MKKILFNNWPILIVLVLALAVSWPIFTPGYFSHHDDLQVMRVFEMRKCLEDFQIPCRWVPDMGYGNGYPLFNYYSVFPYYIGAFLSFIFGFIISAKILFLITILLGALAMFFLAKELVGLYPAILTSVLYTFVPYRALDTYVRGAVAENFAISIIPLVFYFALKIIRQNSRKFFIGLALSLTIFLTSHNIMTLLFIPVLIGFVLYNLIVEKFRNWNWLFGAIMLGFGLSAFFIFPSYSEKNLVQIDNLIRLDLNFRAHFVTLKQLFFDPSWGYGASAIGEADTISFQIGWPYWWIAFISFSVFLVIFVIKRKLNNFLIPFFFIVFLFSVFMTHVRSAFIWEKIEVLKFVQFPWRFLAVSAFSSSLLGGYLVYIAKDVYRKSLVIILIILTVVLNFSFFKPKEFYPDLNDQKKLSGILWEEQQKAAILDYLPQTAVQPREAALNTPIVRSGNATVEPLKNKSNRWEFKTKVKDSATIEVPVFDFPIWKVKVNGKDTSFSNKNYPGRISINFEKGGDYLVEGKLTDTPIRLISNTVTLLSLIVLLVIIFYGRIKKSIK